MCVYIYIPIPAPAAEQPSSWVNPVWLSGALSPCCSDAPAP